MCSTMLPYRLRKPLWTTNELIITIVIFCTFTVLSSKYLINKTLQDTHSNTHVYTNLTDFGYFSFCFRHGVNIKGCFAWTLLDDFEWNSGYTIRFGINFVDYKDGFKRYPMLSVRWFKIFLSK